MTRLAWLSLFAIICMAIADFAPLPEPEGEYSKEQNQAMNDLVEISTADDWLSQLERASHGKSKKH